MKKWLVEVKREIADDDFSEIVEAETAREAEQIALEDIPVEEAFDCKVYEV